MDGKGQNTENTINCSQQQHFAAKKKSSALCLLVSLE
jgi:hypothetical protein